MFLHILSFSTHPPFLNYRCMIHAITLLFAIGGAADSRFYLAFDIITSPSPDLLHRMIIFYNFVVNYYERRS